MNGCCTWGFNPVMSLGAYGKARSHHFKRTFKSRWAYCVMWTSTGPRSSPSSGTICVCRVRGTGNRLSHGDNDNRGTDCLTHCALPSCERAREPRSRARRRNATVRLHGDRPGSRTLEPRASAAHPPQHSWLPLRQFFSKFRCSLFFGGCFSSST